MGVLFSSQVCSAPWVFNNPYPAEQSNQDIYYSSFSEQPKTLDPAKSYSSNEYLFTQQIYEPILQYDYFTRPYKLVPHTATAMPEITFLDKNGQPVDKTDEQRIAYTRYLIEIQSGIHYQPHPAFAKKPDGQYWYYPLSEDFIEEHDIQRLGDFSETGTRELLAQDYVYQIKRLADPANNSPLYGLLSEHIAGFSAYGQSLPQHRAFGQFIDLRKYPLQGARVIDDTHYEILLNGRYSQFIYWLAMPFFAPIPWEVDRFYAQPGMEDNNLSLDWYPVGTGAFMLTENNPNRRMVLRKNPNYRKVFFPENASPEDVKKGYAHSPGRTLPMITEAIFTLEKETIPRWNKFLQGYYDLSGISADSYDQAIRVSKDGHAYLSQALKDKKMRLTQTDEPAIYYLGFNMLDPAVGGNEKRARLLRQAISIAVNYDEYIAIFLNGRGRPAQGPLPPGIFGHLEGQEGMNPYVYDWKDGKLQRKSLAYARSLMVQAGYPGGRDPVTGNPLVLHYDVTSSGSPDDKAQLDWMRKQFAKLGISLNVRSTQYNRFQEKMRSGNAQIFFWGWKADYPDPENFLFLLYGPNAKVKFGGENAANYSNAKFDALFEQMRNRENDGKRMALIAEMVQLVQNDAPWVFGVNAQTFTIAQQWLSATKPNTIAPNALQYMKINVPLRNRLRAAWNQPILWPLGILMVIGFLLLLPMWFTYRRMERQQARRIG